MLNTWRRLPPASNFIDAWFASSRASDASLASELCAKAAVGFGAVAVGAGGDAGGGGGAGAVVAVVAGGAS